jgi:hypothetical protein
VTLCSKKILFHNFVVHLRAMKQDNGRRNRNKFPCNYCSKFVFEYARHLMQRHPSKKRVAAILAIPKRQRLKEFAMLRTEAIRNYNAKVLESGKGELIVGRRSVISRTADDYLPCPECRVLCSAKQLWRHYQKCKRSPRKLGQRYCVSRQARVIMEIGLGTKDKHMNFKLDVLSKLRKDEVSAVIKKTRCLACLA